MFTLRKLFQFSKQARFDLKRGASQEPPRPLRVFRLNGGKGAEKAINKQKSAFKRGTGTLLNKQQGGSSIAFDSSARAVTFKEGLLADSANCDPFKTSKAIVLRKS